MDEYRRAWLCDCFENVIKRVYDKISPLSVCFVRVLIKMCLPLHSLSVLILRQYFPIPSAQQDRRSIMKHI